MVNVMDQISVVQVEVAVLDIHQTFVNVQQKIVALFHVQLKVQFVQLYPMVDVQEMESVVDQVSSLVSYKIYPNFAIF